MAAAANSNAGGNKPTTSTPTKTFDYVVICSKDSTVDSKKMDEFKRMVTAKLNDGYTLVGGICSTFSPRTGLRLYQAVMKES